MNNLGYQPLSLSTLGSNSSEARHHKAYSLGGTGTAFDEADEVEVVVVVPDELSSSSGGCRRAIPTISLSLVTITPSRSDNHTTWYSGLGIVTLSQWLKSCNENCVFL